MIEWGVLGLVLEFIGTLMIGFAVLRVHEHVGKEHKIDDDVLASIHHERKVTIVGIVLIVLGFLLQLSKALPLSP